MSSIGRRQMASEILKESARIICMILLADTIVISIASILLKQNFFHDFTALTLVEAAVLFLIGGAKDLCGSIGFRKIANHVNETKKVWTIDEHKQVQEKAAQYIVTGIVLLCLSFILAYPLS